MRVAFVILTGLSIAVAAAFGVGYYQTRPKRPDLSNMSEWMLVKSAPVTTSSSNNLNVRVYVYKRESTDRDPYDVRQNKIVITDSGKHYDFMWPFNHEYAAGWAEVFVSPDGSVSVALFEGESVVRVVRYAAGTFYFRPDRDELIANHDLSFRSAGPNAPTFTDRADGKTWRWTPSGGFESVAS